MYSNLILLLLSWTYIVIASPITLGMAGDLQARDPGSCTDTSQFEAVTVAGSGAGTAFCASDWDAGYKPILSVTAWWDYYSVRGLQVTYADGSRSPLFGAQQGSSGTISVDYALGERFTAWTLYYLLPQYGGNGYLSAVYISNSNGSTLYAGQTPYQLQQTDAYYYPFTQGIGSGFLFGITGASDGTAITSLGGLFLASDLANIQITDLAFPDGPIGAQGIAEDDLASYEEYNSQTNEDATWTFMNSKAFATTHTFTQTVTNTYGTMEAIMISGKIPIIDLGVSETTTFSWSTAYAETNTNTYMETTTVTWSAGGTLMPGEGVQCVAIAGHGSGTFPYTSQVTITLKNGYTFTYEENGELTIDDISNAITQCQSTNGPPS